MESDAQKHMRAKALGEQLAFRKNCSAFFFYSGAFTIELFWGMIWSLIQNFVIHKLHESDGLLDVLFIIAAFGNLLFSLVFGTLASFQERSWLRGKAGVLLMGIFCVGLIISWWLFWTVGIYISAKQDGVGALIYGLCILFFLLIVVTLNGYSAIFFAISNDFGNQIVSKPALPIWSALGQIGSIGVLYFSPILFEDSANFFIMLGVVSGIAGVFMVVSSGAAYVDGLTSEMSTEVAGQFRDFSSFSKKFLITLLSWTDEKVILITFSAAFSSFLLFSLRFAGTYWFSGPPTSDNLAENSFEYDGVFDVALRARLYQQIVQIFCSIIFALTEYLIVKYQLVEEFCICRYSKTVVKYSYTGSELSFHISPQPYGIFNAQFLTTFLGLIGFPIGSLLLLFSPSENVKVLGFAMTGLGSTFLYTSREFQKSFLRVVRLDEYKELSDEVLKKFEFRNRIYGAGFFSACVALGEFFVILLIRFSPITVAGAAFFPIGVLFLVACLCAEMREKHHFRLLEFSPLKPPNTVSAKDPLRPSNFLFRKQRSMPL